MRAQKRLQDMEDHTESDRKAENRLISILERQKKDLVVRYLKKHEELEDGKNFTNKLLASIFCLFFLLDDDFVVVQANQEFYRSLGYSEDAEKSISLEQISGQENCRLIRNALDKGEFNALSIVDQIIREFSGIIKVKSSPGAGACFSVLLPPVTDEERTEVKT